jgi:sporulation protein YlmC with PRC-barrel domain
MKETMMHRYLMIITAVLIGATALAQAQPSASGAVSPLVEVKDKAMMVERFNLSVDQLEDMNIHGAGGKRIGEVDEVLMSAEGQIAALAVEVGGFLGIGDKEVVMELNQLRREGDTLMTDLTKEQIEALQSWDD